MGKRGRGLKFLGRKSNKKKIMVGKNIKLQGTIYSPEGHDSSTPCSILVFKREIFVGDISGIQTASIEKAYLTFTI